MVNTDSWGSDRFVLGLHLPLVSKVEQGKGGSGGHQESDVEQAMIEVELQVAQHRGDDGPVLRRHVHPHQHHHRGEVHAHDLGEEEDEDVGALGAGEPDEELAHGEQESSGGGDGDDPHLKAKKNLQAFISST